jgi:uncharacterized protein
MFLLDANIWMQIARSRPEAAEVRAFLAAVPAERVFVTDMALNSVAINFGRREQLHELPNFLRMTTIGTDIAVLRLSPGKFDRIVQVALTLKLDFEDAYQYVAAELHQLKLVSFDKDFDRTPTGRLTPAAALQLLKDESK